MSFSIGPFIGSSKAVAKAVEKADVYGSTQGEATRAFLLAELALLPSTAGASVHAYGHHDSSNRNVMVKINEFGTTPLLVVHE